MLEMVKNARRRRRRRRTRMEMLMRRRVTTRNTCDLTVLGARTFSWRRGRGTSTWLCAALGFERIARVVIFDLGNKNFGLLPFC